MFDLVRLWLGCIPKISFIVCLEVPQKFVWWVGGGGGWVESEMSDPLWISSSLALAKPNDYTMFLQMDIGCAKVLDLLAGPGTRWNLAVGKKQSLGHGFHPGWELLKLISANYS